MSRDINSVTVRMDDAASSNVRVGERVRLLGVQFYIQGDNGAGSAPQRQLAYRDIKMQDSSGNDIFRFAVPTLGSVGYGCGQQPFNIMPKNSSVVFPDGIHFVNLTTAGTQHPTPEEIQVTVFYEGG